MSISDPISDMLTRIRNAQMANKLFVLIPSSKIKVAIANVLKDEGYIDSFLITENSTSKILKIHLKYHAKRPVIEKIQRVSRPGLRVYKSVSDIPRIMNGLGVVILSTSKGLMVDRKARELRVGGEVLCIVA